MDARYLQRAIELAEEGMLQGLGGPFGALVVRGDEVLAEACNQVTSALDPTAHAEVVAIRAACQRAGVSIDQLDLFEINEAFAGQYLAVEKELGLDRERVNVNGGAIGLGHPLGATGTRLLLTLLIELDKRGKRWGVASACIGGGQGIALIVERT